MKIFDIATEVSAVQMVAPAAVSASGNQAAGTDLQGYQGKLKLALAVGTVSGTSPTLDVKVQDSADNSTFADVSPALAVPQQNAAGINSIAIDPRGVRRYIRVYYTLGGTSPNFTFGVTLLGQKQTI